MPAAAARCGEKREETEGLEAGGAGATRALDGYLRGFYTAGLSTVGLGRVSRRNLPML